MIEEYCFGRIIIDGRKYNYDVEVRWTGEVFPWEKRESHFIGLEEVKRAVGREPEVIVIGTGESGIAKVAEEAREFIEKKGVNLIIGKTGEAVRTFDVIKENSEEEEGKKKKVIGLFHLTC